MDGKYSVPGAKKFSSELSSSKNISSYSIE
jgi:hypothetical protein